MAYFWKTGAVRRGRSDDRAPKVLNCVQHYQPSALLALSLAKQNRYECFSKILRILSATVTGDLARILGPNSAWRNIRSHSQSSIVGRGSCSKRSIFDTPFAPPCTAASFISSVRYQ